MPIKHAKQINLIPQNEFDTSNLGRALKWALSTFRVMVIVTELIVMSAFLSRFWLDAKNSDLNEVINVDKAQVLAYSDVESTFREHQKRLSIAKSIYSQKDLTQLVTSVTSLAPPDVSFNAISITGKDFEVKATALSERSIAQFLVNLEKLTGLEEVNLSQVSGDVENESRTVFTIAGKVK